MTTTIYNPIDIREMAPRKLLRELLGVAPETKVIGTACRIAQVKNPQSFVRVMCGVIERMPEVHAAVIGDGEPELMVELKNLAAGCDHLHFLGYRSDARQLISECDCFVMTSAREGMPTAMLEAMASGVPVAFWKGEGGLVDLAELNEKEGPFGVVAEQGDESGLVSGIVNGLSSSKGERGSAIVSCHFTLENVSKQLLEVYE